MKLVETCGDSLYDDDDFTGDAALYVDVDEPPSDADMGKATEHKMAAAEAASNGEHAKVLEASGRALTPTLALP